MEAPDSSKQARLAEIFDAFNKAWMKYWESYIALQDELYESLRAAREVSWLAATDRSKLSEINQVQRELFAGMPRRLDYVPLGQMAQDLDTAPSKIEELEQALAQEEEGCRKMMDAISVLKSKNDDMKAALRAERK